jgi:hypothetical protein
MSGTVPSNSTYVPYTTAIQEKCGNVNEKITKQRMTIKERV